MLLTHSGMPWIVLTVLSLCPAAWSALNVTQPYKVVSTNGTARVQCFVEPRPSFHQIQPSNEHIPPYPYPDPEELRVTLLKGLQGTQELCSSTLSLTEQTQPGVEKDREVQCSARLREGAVEVTVSGLKATDTDLYRCGIEIFYPPPYLQLTGNGTLIHVLGSSDCPGPETHRQTAKQGDEEEEDEERITSDTSVPVVVLVILVICVLIIIIYFQAKQCERGRREIRVQPVPDVFLKVDAAAISC
ncbi:cytotoxic T-lymphocyte protein 4 [Etheostoma cragini]|uniref:cytotoxic T-lymphocyte protein 4 n=1 Tax=Etheostoma cragini TaxID=417921 RepID=UPI00155F2B83|nr:cytotoxic T-lymphocyte protein 4 [Etheostoma cragini]